MADSEQDENTVEYGSGNVFSDLGLPESEELMVKEKLLGSNPIFVQNCQ